MSDTIYPAKYYPIYKVYYGVDGWFIMLVQDRHTARYVDGHRHYKSRQNAYKRAKQLNNQLKSSDASLS